MSPIMDVDSIYASVVTYNAVHILRRFVLVIDPHDHGQRWLRAVYGRRTQQGGAAPLRELHYGVSEAELQTFGPDLNECLEQAQPVLAVVDCFNSAALGSGLLEAARRNALRKEKLVVVLNRLRFSLTGKDHNAASAISKSGGDLDEMMPVFVCVRQRPKLQHQLRKFVSIVDFRPTMSQMTALVAAMIDSSHAEIQRSMLNLIEANDVAKIEYLVLEKKLLAVVAGAQMSISDRPDWIESTLELAAKWNEAAESLRRTNAATAGVVSGEHLFAHDRDLGAVATKLALMFTCANESTMPLQRFEQIVREKQAQMKQHDWKTSADTDKLLDRVCCAIRETLFEDEAMAFALEYLFESEIVQKRVNLADLGRLTKRHSPDRFVDSLMIRKLKWANRGTLNKLSEFARLPGCGSTLASLDQYGKIWDRWYRSSRPELRMPDEQISFPLPFLGRLLMLSLLRRDRLDACCHTSAASVFSSYGGIDVEAISASTTPLLLLRRRGSRALVSASTFARSIALNSNAQLVVLRSHEPCETAWQLCELAESRTRVQYWMLVEDAHLRGRFLVSLADRIRSDPRLPIKFIITLDAQTILPSALCRRAQIVALDAHTNVREAFNAANASMRGPVGTSAEQTLRRAALLLALQQQREHLKGGIGWHSSRLQWDDSALESIQLELEPVADAVAATDSRTACARGAVQPSHLRHQRCRTLMVGSTRSALDAALVREQSRLLFADRKLEIDDTFKKLEDLGYSPDKTLPSVDDACAFGVDFSEKLHTRPAGSKSIDAFVKRRTEELWAWAEDMPSEKDSVGLEQTQTSAGNQHDLSKSVRAIHRVLPRGVALSEAESRVWSWGGFQPDNRRGNPLNVALRNEIRTIHYIVCSVNKQLRFLRSIHDLNSSAYRKMILALKQQKVPRSWRRMASSISLCGHQGADITPRIEEFLKHNDKEDFDDGDDNGRHVVALIPWVKMLKSQVQQLGRWFRHGRPSIIWLGGFAAPRSLISTFRRQVALHQRWPLSRTIILLRRAESTSTLPDISNAAETAAASSKFLTPSRLNTWTLGGIRVEGGRWCRSSDSIELDSAGTGKDQGLTSTPMPLLELAICDSRHVSVEHSSLMLLSLLGEDADVEFLRQTTPVPLYASTGRQASRMIGYVHSRVSTSKPACWAGPLSTGLAFTMSATAMTVPDTPKVVMVSYSNPALESVLHHISNRLVMKFRFFSGERDLLSDLNTSGEVDLIIVGEHDRTELLVRDLRVQGVQVPVLAVFEGRPKERDDLDLVGVNQTLFYPSLRGSHCKDDLMRTIRSILQDDFQYVSVADPSNPAIESTARS